MTGKLPLPVILPLGDGALLVRFADTLSDAANRVAIAFARTLADSEVTGIAEIVPNLVSVLVRADDGTDIGRLAGEIRLLLAGPGHAAAPETAAHTIAVRFGEADGPDLEAAAATLGLSRQAFIAAHNETPLRVLTTGFAPGFVYCGFHGDALSLPRRNSLRENVPPGSILFAAGQTAVSATTIRTGWHVIGRTDFRNFNAAAMPPTLLREGDSVRFIEARA